MKMLVLSAGVAHAVHLFFEWAAIATGIQVYRWQRARRGLAGILSPGQYAVIIGCILGAAVGNKLVFWIEFPQLWASSFNDMTVWMSGQSIVGGLLGGLIGVEIAKKLAGVRESTGDSFVLPLIVGTIVGRVGCFLAGLNDGTYGNPTSLPWGVDFGDGIPRHPTQLYDMLFALLYGGWLLSMRRQWAMAPGLLFKCYLSGYLAWRLIVDSIKPVPFNYGAGISGIQLICIIALFIYLPYVAKQFMEMRNHASIRR